MSDIVSACSESLHKRPAHEARVSTSVCTCEFSCLRYMLVLISRRSVLLFLLPFLPLLGSKATAGDSNSLMDISSDGKLLACSNRDSGTVSIVDLHDNKKTQEISVGHKPEGVTFLGDSHRLAVAVYADDAVVFLDGDQGKPIGTVEVFDEPYGVVSNTKGTRLYVTLDYPGQIIEIDVAKQSLVRSLDAGKFVRGIAVDSSNSRLLITEYYTALVKAVDLDSGKVVDQWAGASTDNLARQITLHPTRPKAYLPHIRSRVVAAHGEGSIFPYISVVDTQPGEGRRRSRFPMDSFLGNLVTSSPWEVAVSPDGQQFYVVFSATNDMFACKVLNDNYREIELRSRLQLGNNPRAVRVAPDNKTFYVYNALDFEVVAYDAERLRKVATIPVTENPLGERVLRGKRLFYSALQPMVGRRWISCSSCHPDGEPDGRTWHNPEGLRNTQSLAGMAWTHPIHWSADRDEVQDFEHTIRGPLMQGRGLVSGRLNDSLGAPNRLLSEDLDALSAYANSHKFTISPHAKSGLSKAAKRGQLIFHSQETRCATCHSGPFYTDSVPRPAPEIVRHDVGTGNDDPSEKMGPAYDTPTLLGVYRTAPYLHHGKAKTLKEVLVECNKGDKHGKTSHLSEQDSDDLVEFLKSLPFEDPVPQAKEAGLTKVVD